MLRVNGPNCGFQPAGWPTFIHPRFPWTRPRVDHDPAFTTGSGGGRRLIHPYLDDIVYPENPNRTIGFDWDVIRRTRAVVTRTEKGSAVTHYPEYHDDPVITEVWDAGSASVTVEFYRLLKEYRETPLPTGEYCGWQPRDLCPYNYFVELVDVRVGNGDTDEIEEHGDKEPYLLHQPLTLVFKLVQEARSPGGVIVFLGQ